ncbi:PQQ-like beta-propeller repeat protein [Actibacterium sp. XHP0104]|uniref:PQQ-like beta-propeller repeat protein n=1 Tax=Actibacterium sp. XHP0104 TaxID=2984335 RepID=UPI0021E94AAD|nr:PQQ-like beta-propeller repeat protein [Actibacterium sp. XHP0104]MCV2881541.1 PQQ-like beta-propeller repeat protein [Actibacterium sp. XHP0104]
MKLSQTIALLAALGVLGACDREVILEGERIDVRDSFLADATDAPAEQDAAPVARALSLPAAQALSEWTQTNGGPAHAPLHHDYAGNGTLIWSANIGEGNSRRYRIASDPVVADGRIFTIDAQNRVMAHSSDGAALWSTDLVPATDNAKDANGGALAYGDGQLFVTSGFGQLSALDPATGAVTWVQDTDAAMSGAPAYKDGLVYVVARDNSAWAIRAQDGRVQWQLPGTPSPSGLLGAAAPAVSERVVIFPFGASELTATLRKGGIRVWGSSVSGQRRGRVYSTISDVTGDPVMVGDTVYVATQSGRTVALTAAGGDRIWTAEEGSYSPVLPIGGAVFLTSDAGQLIRLDAETGETVWAVDLPYFTKEKIKRRKAVHAHYGPVMANGRLIVASDDGLIRFFSPEDGSLISTAPIPGGAASEPVIVGGVMYILGAKGQLHAFR